MSCDIENAKMNRIATCMRHVSLMLHACVYAASGRLFIAFHHSIKILKNKNNNDDDVGKCLSTCSIDAMPCDANVCIRTMGARGDAKCIRQCVPFNYYYYYRCSCCVCVCRR